MSKFNKYRRRLLTTALVTSPFIGILSMTPVFLFVRFLADQDIPVREPGLLQAFAGIFFISFSIFIIWLINIGLFALFSSGRVSSKISMERPVGKLTVGLLSFCCVFLYVLFITSFPPAERPVDPGWFRFYPFVATFSGNAFILILIRLIVTQIDQSELKLQKAELEISQLIARQEQLKQQIHPHFLFNALGTLQILISKDHKKASDYTAQLARFLRSSLTLAERDVLPLQAELKFLQDYIDLQKMRFGEGIKLEVNIPEAVRESARLPVFSLQILAENAVKHNAFSSENPLIISILYNAEGHLEVSNNRTPKYTEVLSAGIGLQNLSERFKHFTDRLPEISESATDFSVRLHILGSAN